MEKSDGTINYEDLLKAKEDNTLEVGETFEFFVDAYEVRESNAGNNMMFLDLAVADGAKKGVKVRTFGPAFPNDTDPQKVNMYIRNLKPFGLDIQSAADTGAVDATQESLINLGEELVGKKVKGRVQKGDDYNDVKVFLIPKKV